MLEACDREGADRLLLLGDILYHGPRNDLPEEYAPKQVLAMLNEQKDRILCVRGNCDGEVDQMVLQFPILADYSILTVGERLVYVTHGHNINVDHPLPAWTPFGEDNLYLNPGSVSIPKENSAHGYMVLEDRTFIWKDMDGSEYHRETV